MIESEREVLKGYICPAGVLTVGIGHAVLPGEPYKLNQKITLEESRRLFEKDTAWTVQAVNDFVKVPLTQNQFDALCSLVFNIGKTAFKNSTLLRKLNARDYQGAAQAFLSWNKGRVKGKLVVLPGLVTRRAKEKSLFERA